MAILSVTNEKVYVPEWGANRDEAPSDQIRVVHRFLSYGDRQELVRKTDTTYVVQEDGQARPAFTVKTDHERVVKKMVKRFENLAVEIDGEIREIKTAEDFWACEVLPPALSREIVEHLIDATPVVDTDPTK